MYPYINNFCSYQKGAIAGGVFGLVVVVAAGGGAQLAQVPLPHLPTSIDLCPDYYNLTALNIVPR